jgi:hypothetical protein
MTKFLRLKFGSLSNAFSSSNDVTNDANIVNDVQNKTELNKFFSLLFMDLLTDVEDFEKSGNLFLDLKTFYKQNPIQVNISCSNVCFRSIF